MTHPGIQRFLKGSEIQHPRARILVQVTIYRRLLIGRDGHLDQSDAYDIQHPRARILVQVTIYRRLLIGRDGHLDQSDAYDIS